MFLGAVLLLRAVGSHVFLMTRLVPGTPPYTVAL